MKVVDFSGNPISSSSDFVESVPVESTTDRLKPRQEGFGAKRGAQVTYGADGKPQVLVGKQETFGNGFYVAKPAIDVITNTDPAQLIFNSNQNVFKIVSSGTATMTVGTYDIQSVSVSHNLNYVPAVLAFMVLTNAYIALPASLSQSVGTLGANTVQMQDYTSYLVTDTSITFSAVNADNLNALGVVTIKYYLLQETAS